MRGIKFIIVLISILSISSCIECPFIGKKDDVLSVQTIQYHEETYSLVQTWNQIYLKKNFFRVWTHQAGADVPILFTGNSVFFVERFQTFSEIHSINIETGELQKTIEVSGWISMLGEISPDELIVIGSVMGESTYTEDIGYQKTVWKLDIGSGQVTELFRFYGEIYEQPLFSSNKIFIVSNHSDMLSRDILCFSLIENKLLWSYEIPGHTIGTYKRTIFINDNLIEYVSEEGKILELDTETGLKVETRDGQSSK